MNKTLDNMVHCKGDKNVFKKKIINALARMFLKPQYT